MVLPGNPVLDCRLELNRSLYRYFDSLYFGVTLSLTLPRSLLLYVAFAATSIVVRPTPLASCIFLVALGSWPAFESTEFRSWPAQWKTFLDFHFLLFY